MRLGQNVRRVLGSGIVVGFVAALLAQGSCSAFYDLDATQCEADEDCARFGERIVCRDSFCVTSTEEGSGGSGGVNDRTGGSAGQAGAPGSDDCATNEDCIVAHYNLPYVCRDGACVELKSPDCPLVLGAGEDPENKYLKTSAPIIVGAFANFDPVLPVSKSRYNYELAFEEFNDRTNGGLPASLGHPRRPLIAVVCGATDFDEERLERSLDHLVDDLRVPAILASVIDQDDLQDAFEYVNDVNGKDANVFFLSPFASNDTLAKLPDDGLLWHMLGPATDQAAPYVPLVARAETYQNRLRPDPDKPLRVLLIESSVALNTELAEEVASTIVFNGKSALENFADGNFEVARIDTGGTTTDPDYGTAVAALADEERTPQIIIGLATNELFEELLVPIEFDWNEEARGGEPRPLYLLSPLLANSQVVLARTQHPSLPTLRDRILGVNFASVDPKLYTKYYQNLVFTFPDTGLELASTENYYDAAYFLFYSFVMAGDLEEYTGSDLARGMTRLIRMDVDFDDCSLPDCVPVDASVLGSVPPLLRQISSRDGIGLLGTMGPPDFDASSGTRTRPTSVWCISDDGASYVPDVLMYDAETQTLTGDFTCFEGF